MPPANCRLIDDTWFILKERKEIEILRRKREIIRRKRGYKAVNDGEMLGFPNSYAGGI
jgi:hypothetical protein